MASALKSSLPLQKKNKSSASTKKRLLSLEEGRTLWPRVKAPFALSVPQWLVKRTQVDLARVRSAKEALTSSKSSKAQSSNVPAPSDPNLLLTGAIPSVPSAAPPSLRLLEGSEVTAEHEARQAVDAPDQSPLPELIGGAFDSGSSAAFSPCLDDMHKRKSYPKLALQKALEAERKAQCVLQQQLELEQKRPMKTFVDKSDPVPLILGASKKKPVPKEKAASSGARGNTNKKDNVEQGSVSQKENVGATILRGSNDALLLGPACGGVTRRQLGGLASPTALQRPSILARPSEHKETMAGRSACTLHSIRDREFDDWDEDHADPSDAQSASSAGDRKYIVRIPPVSFNPKLMSPSPSSSSLAGSKSNTASACSLMGNQNLLEKDVSLKSLSKHSSQSASSKSLSHVSSGQSLAKSGPERLRGSGASWQYLNFEKWSIDDSYICCLCNTHAESFETVKHVNFAHNNLTTRGLEDLFYMLTSPHVASINLAYNKLGRKGGLVVVKALRDARWPITELNLSENHLGDIAVEKLCDALESCRQLSGLGLAKNALGRAERSGKALGSLISTCYTLTVLDLEWNHFQGAGGAAFASGVYQHAEGSDGGSLMRMNLSYNCLGTHHKVGVDDSEEIIARMFASFFMVSTSLFHLDLSFNGMDSNMCRILGDGLKKNHTLFGIHLQGNECSVDDLGFCIPASKAFEEKMEAERGQEGKNEMVRSIPRKLGIDVAVRLLPSELASRPNVDQLTRDTSATQLNESSSEKRMSLGSLTSFTSMQTWDLDDEKKWVENWAKVERPAQFAGQETSILSKNCQCCWICENWFAQEVQYIPGVSDKQFQVAEIKEVYAFFSIDNFTRPLKLSQQEETFNKRAWKPSTRKAADRKPFLKDNGKLVTWVGRRMLPPSMVSAQVLFQVNNKIIASDNVKQIKLQSPIKVNLKVSPLLENLIDEENTSVEVAVVNSVCVAIRALDRYLRGEGTPLVVLENPAQRGDIEVVPRKLPEDAKPKVEREEWTFPKSCWKDWKFDSDKLALECFDLDFESNKLSKLMRGATQAATNNMIEQFKIAIRPMYQKIMCAYRHVVGRGDFTGKFPFGAPLLEYTNWLRDLAPDFFNNQFSVTRDSDTIFIAANLVEKHKKDIFLVCPEKGLARCQFFEALVRVAHKKYFLTGQCVNYHDAFKELYKLMQPFCDEYWNLRQTFQQELFNEENDMVYKGHLDMLRVIFDSYKMHGTYPGRRGKNMTYIAWDQFLKDARVIEFLDHRQFCAAFLLGKSLIVDEYGSWHLMEISWSEWLVALAGIVRLRDNYSPPFFADMLEEFFEDYLTDVYQQVIINDGAHKGKNVVAGQDPTLIPILNFLRKVFEQADDDHSGTINIREFRLSMASEDTKAELESLGVDATDVGVLFKKIDSDGSGEATLDEMCDAFVKIKLQMKGVERAVAYLTRAFKEADEDSSGVLNIDEFKAVFLQPTVQKKLQSLGVDQDDTDDLIALIDSDGSGEITLDELIDGFLQILDATKGGNRALNFMKTLFNEADKDGSGALSRSEMKKAFAQRSCADKLKKLNLVLPDWDELFTQLDLDGSGDVSWEELQEGMSIYWQNNQVAQADTGVLSETNKRVVVDTGDKDDSSRPTTVGTSRPTTVGTLNASTNL